MYLKVKQGSQLFSKLFDALETDRLRNINFKKWQTENLPEFNGDILTRRSPWYLYSDIVGWRLEGEIDKKVWQPVKGFDEYYEPNKRTKVGKAMRERIYAARGKRLNCLDFFDIFGTSAPMGSHRFIVPKGFIYDGVCYMWFDDANYDDISTKMAGQFEEITHGEWSAAMDADIREKLS